MKDTSGSSFVAPQSGMFHSGVANCMTQSGTACSACATGYSLASNSCVVSPVPPPTAPPAPACTDTPASTAASASKVTLERVAGSPVSLELLEDGVVRFTDATCIEATLCNACGSIGGSSSSSAMASDIADMKIGNRESGNMQCGGGICKTPVTWRRGTNDGNAEDSTPGQLSKKLSGTSPGWDTGAASTADLTERTGPQGVEFRCGRSSGTNTKVGLSHGGKEFSVRDHFLSIDFAVYCVLDTCPAPQKLSECAGHLEISEGGVDHIAGEWTPDDVFKVRQSVSARAGRRGGGYPTRTPTSSRSHAPSPIPLWRVHHALSSMCILTS